MCKSIFFYVFVAYYMVLKDKRNHSDCFFVCDLRPDFEKVERDVRRSLEPFKDLDSLFNSFDQTLSNTLQQYMCFSYFFFFVFKYTVSPEEITREIHFSKPYSRYPLFLKHIWNSVRFLLNAERDELALGGVRLLSWIPYLRL